jgi:hypothetical protein
MVLHQRKFALFCFSLADKDNGAVIGGPSQKIQPPSEKTVFLLAGIGKYFAFLNNNGEQWLSDREEIHIPGIVIFTSQISNVTSDVSRLPAVQRTAELSQ